MAGRCPICGALNSACGQRTSTVGITIERKAEAMPGELKVYKVTINGYETTMRLSEEDAKERGATPVDAPKKQAAPAKKQAPQASNKARTAANK